MNAFAAFFDGRVILSSVASTKESVRERMCQSLEIDKATFDSRGYRVLAVCVRWETYQV